MRNAEFGIKFLLVSDLADPGITWPVKELLETLYPLSPATISLYEDFFILRLEILPLAPRHLESMAQIFLDAFREEPWNDNWEDPAQLRRYLNSFFESPHNLALGLFDGEKLLGLALGHLKYWFTGTELIVDEFCLHPHYQGHGRGAAFMQLLQNYLQERHITHILLITDRQAPALNFYRKQGFQEVPNSILLERKTDKSNSECLIRNSELYGSC